MMSLPPNGLLPKTYGVTGPISINGPTRAEELSTTALMDELKERRTFESPEEARARELVLGRLNLLVKEFVIKVSLALGMSDHVARETGGKIFTFGSYRLGVHGPGSDIDTLCVVPRQVTREHFFEILPQMLKERPEVTELSTVPEAFVPIISLKFSGIEVDLLFARLALPSVPDDLELKDDALLKNLDDRCVRSLGGSRVTDEILRLVPDVEVFRHSLRAIKLWAKNRAVYSNVMGFCGGVAWAMCTARVCQLYPNKPAATIVNRFFAVLSQWNWPSPVLLKAIGSGPIGDQRRVWNPKIYPQDRGHRMPIITPAYPCMCSTHNVTKSTAQVMMTEFKRGLAVTDAIATGSAQWSALFEKHDFFTRYRNYIQITASSPEADAHLKWAGTVESRLRLLVLKVEEIETVDMAHPFIKGFSNTTYALNRQEVSLVQGGDMPNEIASRIPEDYENRADVEVVHTCSFFVGLLVHPKPVGHVGPRKLDITYPVGEFTRMVKQWEGYSEDKMSISVRHIKNCYLPDFVFEGAPRPPPTVSSSKGLKRKQTSKVKSNSIAVPASTTTVTPKDNGTSTNLTATNVVITPISTTTPNLTVDQNINTSTTPIGLHRKQQTEEIVSTTSLDGTKKRRGTTHDGTTTITPSTTVTPPLSEMKLISNPTSPTNTTATTNHLLQSRTY